MNYTGLLRRHTWKKFAKNMGAIGLYHRTEADRIGRTSADPQPGKYGDFLVDETISDSAITTQTITSSEGTATFSIAAGAITCTGAGTAWNITLSDGTVYLYPAEVGNDALWWKAAGGVATATVADTAAHCQESVTQGYSLNVLGYTLSDGSTYYREAAATNLIPADVVIPALADGSGCAAYLSDGSVAPLQYPGPIKQDLQPYDKQVATFDGTSSEITFGDLYDLDGNTLTVSFSTVIEDDTNPQFIVGRKGDLGNGKGWAVIISGGELKAFCGDGSAAYITSGYAVTVGSVVDVVAVFDDVGESIALTVNDTVIGSVDLSGNAGFSNAIDLMAGRLPDTTYPFAGQSYDLTIGDYHFPLEESSGTTVYGYHTTTGAVLTGTISTADIGAFWAGTVDAVKSHGSTYGYSASENLIPYSEPDDIAQFTSKGGDGYSMVTATGDIAAYADTVARIGDVTTSTYLYQSYDDNPESNERTLALLVQMEDGTEPVVTASTSDGDGDFAVVINNDLVSVPSVSVERVQQTDVYLVTASKTATAGPSSGVVQYTGNSGKAFTFTKLHLTEEDGAYTHTTGTSLLLHNIPTNPLTGLACDGNALTNPAGFLNDSQQWAVPETREMWDAQQAQNGPNIADAPNLTAFVTVDGNEVFPTADTAVHYVKLGENGDFTVGTDYIATVKAQAAGVRYIKYVQYMQYCNIDLADGSVHSTDGITATVSGPDADGYYLCTFEYTQNNSTAGPNVVLSPNATAHWDDSYLGVPSEGVYVDFDSVEIRTTTSDDETLMESDGTPTPRDYSGWTADELLGPELFTEEQQNCDGGWTTSAECELVDGELRIYSSDGGYQYASVEGVATVGATYKVTGTVTKIDIVGSGGVIIEDADTTAVTSLGDFTRNVTVYNTRILFKRTSGVTDFYLDNISVKEVISDPSRINDNQIFVSDTQMTIMDEPVTGDDITKTRNEHGVS